jgi:hypothetical protein
VSDTFCNGLSHHIGVSYNRYRRCRTPG